MPFTGTCNRCGHCCRIGPYVCEYLRDNPIDRMTTCAIYDRRYDGMPIILRGPGGERVPGRCWKDSSQEDAVIRSVPDCSLVWVDGGR